MRKMQEKQKLTQEEQEMFRYNRAIRCFLHCFANLVGIALQGGRGPHEGEEEPDVSQRRERARYIKVFYFLKKYVDK